MGSGWRLGRQRPPDRCKRRMNSHIVDCLERQPGPLRKPQPARACLVGLGRSPVMHSGSDMSQVADLPTAIVGRFLAYVTGEYQDLAMAVTASSSASGIVVRDSSPLDALRRSRASGYRPSVALDVGAWTTQVATPKSPTLLHAPGALMQISLDSWASDLLSAGAAAVLTPSKFVRAGNWAALQAVLDAGKETSLPGAGTRQSRSCGLK